LGFQLDRDALVKMGAWAALETEADLYRTLGLQFIPPELREGRGEIDAAAAGKLPCLVELSQIRGDLHLHSNWSDGHATIEEMRAAAGLRGYQYIAITDHSPLAEDRRRPLPGAAGPPGGADQKTAPG